MTTYSKLEIATEQLRTAVMLFCSARDRFSAITLAGAADVILSQLLLNAGRQNFTDDLMRAEAETTGVLPERAIRGRAVNDLLMINALKHMDRADDDYLDMDVRVSALAAVSKAVANYYKLVGPAEADRSDFMRIFRLWARIFTPHGVAEDGTAK